MSHSLRRILTVAFIGIASVFSTRADASPVVDFVTVGDAGNSAGMNSRGAVAYSYSIMKYEWTNALYVDFLNAVDPDGENPDELWSVLMGSNSRGGISQVLGNAAGSRYVVKANMGDKPVNYVRWFDAARVANWLHNGALTYETTASGSAAIDSGAYTLNGAVNGTAPAKNVGAKYWVPTTDEWFKAAYYKGGGTDAGYWSYATQSNTAPTAVTAGSTGIGSAGATGNYANFNNDADWNTLNGNVTSVGTNGGPSAYGTFDMSGNLYEINSLSGAAGTTRGLLGGSYADTSVYLSTSYGGSTINSDSEGFLYGFRLAGIPVDVPEIDPGGLASALAIVLGALGLHERRRSTSA